MNLFSASAISTAVVIGASFLRWIDAAHAQLKPSEAPHAEDGVYAVDITTLQGDCNSVYHWAISVSGGHVTLDVDTPIEASGQINQRGIVDLTFRGMDKVSRLADGSGSGTWSFPPPCTPLGHGTLSGTTEAASSSLMATNRARS